MCLVWPRDWVTFGDSGCEWPLVEFNSIWLIERFNLGRNLIN